MVGQCLSVCVERMSCRTHVCVCVERMSVCVERMSVCVERTTLLPYLGCEGIYLKDRIKEK